ncbi:MAG: type II secretion system F family protein [Elusimicrobiota bacterium]|jgi:tight adherence protein B|nr:type II secretion system F family protein [Elusimicrobiota bacterium]
MKYLFLFSFSGVVFCFTFLCAMTIKKHEASLKNLAAKIKERKKAPPNPQVLKVINKIGGKKNAVVLFSICFLVLLLSWNLFFVIIAAIFYFYINWNIKTSRAKKLQTLIDKQVIEALSLIKNSVLAGRTIQDAIVLASKDLKDPLRTEFEKIAKDFSLGISLDRALEKASLCALSKEHKLAMDTIRLSVQSGASISGIFERITDAASQRLSLREKIDALTAQGKMSGNVVSAVPFVVMLMMSLLQPEMMTALFNTFAGNVLLLIVVIMILVGSFSIRKLTEVDY